MTPWRMLTGALAAAAIGAGLAAQPRAIQATDAALVRMEERIARLEARLGIQPALASHAGYAELRQREIRLAARMDSARAWIPDAAPLAAGAITSSYTARRFHPVMRRVLPHWGIDVAAPHGAPVLATADGEVLATFRSPSYGTGVDLRHGTAFITRYAHLSALAVRSGARVRRGQVIGYVGATGRTTGPHLHYEVYSRRAGGYQSIDPARLLSADGPLGL